MIESRWDSKCGMEVEVRAGQDASGEFRQSGSSALQCVGCLDRSGSDESLGWMIELRGIRNESRRGHGNEVGAVGIFFR